MRNLIVCTLLMFVSLFASCSTMLEKAAVNNDVEMAKQALAKGEKIEDQKFVGLTAARWGSIAFLEFLLQQKYDLKYKDEKGRTLLHAAVSPPEMVGSDDKIRKLYEDRLNAALFLIKNGVDVNAVDNDGITPLLQAVGGDFIELDRKLKKESEKIAEQRKKVEFGRSADDAVELSKMVQEYEKSREKGMEDIRRLNGLQLPFDRMATALLNAGANTKAVESLNQNTALHLAVLRQSEATVKALTGKGASTNAQNSFGNTPVHLARSQRPVYDLLIQAKADPRILNKDMLTAYDMADWRIDVWAAAGRGDTAAVEEYIKLGGSVDAYGRYINIWGWTPMHVAAYQGQRGVVDLLLKNKADINALFRGNLGDVPFPMSLANINPFAAMKSMTSGKTPVSTPVLLAQKNEKKELVDYMTSKGAFDAVPFAETGDYMKKWQSRRMWGYRVDR